MQVSVNSTCDDRQLPNIGPLHNILIDSVPPHDTRKGDVDASTDVSRFKYRLPIRTMVPQSTYGKCHDDIALTLLEHCVHRNSVATARRYLHVEFLIECYTHRCYSRTKSIISNKFEWFWKILNLVRNFHSENFCWFFIRHTLSRKYT